MSGSRCLYHVKSNLKIDANGEIRLEGVSGDVELTGDDESINVRDVDGNLRVSNSDGHIRVIGFKGRIDARSDDGTIDLEGDFASLKASASDGSITLTLPENTAADIDCNCNRIEGEGIELSRLNSGDGRSKYRIGKGGANFQIDSEGEIRVRSTNVLLASY